MSTPTLTDLLSEVRRDIALAETRIVKLRDIEDYLAGKLSEAPGLSTSALMEQTRVSVVHANGILPRNDGATTQSLPAKIRPGMSQRDAAEIALRELGREAHVTEILDTMFKLGYENSNSNINVLKNSIYSAMLRSPNRFERVGRGRWRLKDEPIAPSHGEDGDLFREEEE